METANNLSERMNKLTCSEYQKELARRAVAGGYRTELQLEKWIDEEEMKFDNVVTVDTKVHTEQDFIESNQALDSSKEYKYVSEYVSTSYRDDEDDEYANVNCNEI